MNVIFVFVVAALPGKSLFLAFSSKLHEREYKKKENTYPTKLIMKTKRQRILSQTP